MRTIDAAALRKRSDQLARDARELDIRIEATSLPQPERGIMEGSRAEPRWFESGTVQRMRRIVHRPSGTENIVRPDVDRVRRGRVWGIRATDDSERMPAVILAFGGALLLRQRLPHDTLLFHRVSPGVPL